MGNLSTKPHCFWFPLATSHDQIISNLNYRRDSHPTQDGIVIQIHPVFPFPNPKRVKSASSRFIVVGSIFPSPSITTMAFPIPQCRVDISKSQRYRERERGRVLDKEPLLGSQSSGPQVLNRCKSIGCIIISMSEAQAGPTPCWA